MVSTRTRRLLWFFGLWALGVLTISVVGLFIKLALCASCTGPLVCKSFRIRVDRLRVEPCH